MMIKKGFVIGLVILLLIGSLTSGITINLKDSVQKSVHENTLNIVSSGSKPVAYRG